jgi:CrcB protein
MARHAVNHLVHTRALTTTFPVGTIVVNAAGCFLIGLLAGLIAAERLALRVHWREFVFVGLLGGFTTFSTFGLDTYLLTRTHSTRLAFVNVAAHVLGGLLAVWAGYHIGSRT